jgi:hypothetical protein
MCISYTAVLIMLTCLHAVLIHYYNCIPFRLVREAAELSSNNMEEAWCHTRMLVLGQRASNYKNRGVYSRGVYTHACVLFDYPADDTPSQTDETSASPSCILHANHQ